jgi:hypothetical protein
MKMIKGLEVKVEVDGERERNEDGLVRGLGADTTQGRVGRVLDGEVGRVVVRYERSWNVSIDCSWAVLCSVLGHCD